MNLVMKHSIHHSC